MEITLHEMQERLNGRCVTVSFKNANAFCPLTFNNIEMVVYKNGEIQFCEQDEEVHYSPIYQSASIEEIQFLDFSSMPDQTGGQFFVHFDNGDMLDITGDF